MSLIKVREINELNADQGVTIEGVLIKDGAVSALRGPSGLDVSRSPYNVSASATGAANKAGLQAAVDALVGEEDKRILLPEGTLSISGTVTLADRGYHFIGVRDGRVTQGGGTRIAFTGTGACIQIGTSKIVGSPLFDLSYDDVDYDGHQETYFDDISWEYTGAATTALNNGQGSYGTGTIAVQDWRGGHVRMNRCWFEKFEYWFWGVQSDINDFQNITALYCKYGAYLGPRSDQFTLRGYYPTLCDTALWLDRVSNPRIYTSQFVGLGSATDYPIKIGSQYPSVGCRGVLFDGCWFENAQYAVTIPIIGVGVGDAVQTVDVVIRDPYISVDAGKHSHLLRIENATRVEVQRPSGNPNDFTALVEFVGSTSPAVHVVAHVDRVRGYTNSGTGTPAFSYAAWGNGSNYLASSNGRLHLKRQPDSTTADCFIGTENAFNFYVNFPGETGEKNLVKFTRRVQHAAAAPVSGTWSIGDIVWNTAPAVLGGAGSQYVIHGWTCTVAGTPGTWVEMRTLTGT